MLRLKLYEASSTTHRSTLGSSKHHHTSKEMPYRSERQSPTMLRPKLYEASSTTLGSSKHHHTSKGIPYHIEPPSTTTYPCMRGRCQQRHPRAGALPHTCVRICQATRTIFIAVSGTASTIRFRHECTLLFHEDAVLPCSFTTATRSAIATAVNETTSTKRITTVAVSARSTTE